MRNGNQARRRRLRNKLRRGFTERKSHLLPQTAYKFKPLPKLAIFGIIIVKCGSKNRLIPKYTKGKPCAKMR